MGDTARLLGGPSRRAYASRVGSGTTRMRTTERGLRGIAMSVSRLGRIVGATGTVSSRKCAGRDFRTLRRNVERTRMLLGNACARSRMGRGATVLGRQVDKLHTSGATLRRGCSGVGSVARNRTASRS